MRIAALVILSILFGCSARPTLEELEAEALASGDWSKVEKREAVVERHSSRDGR